MRCCVMQLAHSALLHQVAGWTEIRDALTVTDLAMRLETPVL